MKHTPISLHKAYSTDGIELDAMLNFLSKEEELAQVVVKWLKK